MRPTGTPASRVLSDSTRLPGRAGVRRECRRRSSAESARRSHSCSFAYIRGHNRLAMQLPDQIRDVAHLEELLSEPSPAAIDAIRRAPGDVVVLGVAGKMGPTLARVDRRAMDAAGVS